MYPSLYCVIRVVVNADPLQVMEDIGPWRFIGISSDNTGNTTLARQLLKSDYGIMILPDPDHRLNSLCKDIGGMPVFDDVCPHLRARM
jgi:hypothetical protein